MCVYLEKEALRQKVRGKSIRDIEKEGGNE